MCQIEKFLDTWNRAVGFAADISNGRRTAHLALPLPRGFIDTPFCRRWTISIRSIATRAKIVAAASHGALAVATVTASAAAITTAIATAAAATTAYSTNREER